MGELRPFEFIVVEDKTGRVDAQVNLKSGARKLPNSYVSADIDPGPPPFIARNRVFKCS